MQPINEEQLRELLGKYRVPGPRPALVEQTKRLMREEMLLMPAKVEPVRQPGMVLVLAVLSLLICFGMFYTATLGTILSFTLPGSLLVLLKHSILGVSAAGVSLVIGAVILIFFKSFQRQKALSHGI
ncbi:MAG TPA: hypothetical protein VM123_17335 [archaeon]|nr:hypothetical protein [archaeon]